MVELCVAVHARAVLVEVKQKMSREQYAEVYDALQRKAWQIRQIFANMGLHHLANQPAATPSKRRVDVDVDMPVYDVVDVDVDMPDVDAGSAVVILDSDSDSDTCPADLTQQDIEDLVADPLLLLRRTAPAPDATTEAAIAVLERAAQGLTDLLERSGSDTPMSSAKAQFYEFWSARNEAATLLTSYNACWTAPEAWRLLSPPLNSRAAPPERWAPPQAMPESGLVAAMDGAACDGTPLVTLDEGGWHLALPVRAEAAQDKRQRQAAACLCYCSSERPTA
jgi:hypothetical protein